MKTLTELKQYYESDLLPDLKVLETRRLQIVRKLMYVGLALGIIAAIVIIAILSYARGNLIALLFPLIGGGAIFMLAMKFFSQGYVGDFKTTIIDKIVHFIDQSLNYDPHNCLSESTFRSCEIFQKRPDRYQGDDFVYGKIGKTEIKFSEIHAEYKTESRDSKGRRQTHWHTIFKGMFFMGDFNKDFAGLTVVLPDTAERLFGRLGRKLQSLNFTRGKLISLEDPEFEKLFSVYGDDQIEARYILSTSLMKRIVDFKKKTNRRIYLSFAGSRVFVAISYDRDLFEPRLFNTLLDFAPIQQYFEDLQIAVGIVEDLNLNTRIWSKQ